MHPSTTARSRPRHTIQSISSMANLAHSSDLCGPCASSPTAVAVQRAKRPENSNGPIGPRQRADRQLGRPGLHRHDETDGVTSWPISAALGPPSSLDEIGEAYRVFSNRLDGVLKVAIRP
jgi:hypothetical protein